MVCTNIYEVAISPQLNHKMSMSYQDVLAESVVGNDALWILVGTMMIVMGNVYSERTIEFGGQVNAFLGLSAMALGWALFLSYDYTVARPIGIIIPFIHVALYMYMSWVLGQEQERVKQFAVVTYVFWMVLFAAWVAYIYYKSRDQPPRLAALNVVGMIFVLTGTFMSYNSVPRKYTMMTIVGNREVVEATYYGTTVFSPVYVFMTAGWAFLGVNELINNLLTL